MKNIKFLILISSFLCAFSANGQIRNLQVESNHSTVGFSISISGFSQVFGTFGDYEIFVDWDDSDYTASSIDASIQVESINTGIPDRDAHLKTKDFFDVEKYPTIDFVSDSISQVDFSNFIAHGKFTMHGVTKSMQLPFTIVKMDGNTIGFRIRTIIDRSEF